MKMFTTFGLSIVLRFIKIIFYIDEDLITTDDKRID
jgi:hypothetical protein